VLLDVDITEPRFTVRRRDDLDAPHECPLPVSAPTPSQSRARAPRSRTLASIRDQRVSHTRPIRPVATRLYSNGHDQDVVRNVEAHREPRLTFPSGVSFDAELPLYG
jgi:hypothetical protein